MLLNTPLLAIRWLEKHNTAAPIEFSKLLGLIYDDELLVSIYQLLEKKKISEEKILAPSIPVLNKFIELELQRLENMKLTNLPMQTDTHQINELFHTVLKKDVD